MIFVNITEGVAADGTRIHTVNKDGVNVVAIIGRDGHGDITCTENHRVGG